MISISLNPNVEKDDVLLALKLLFNPFKWKKGTQELEQRFKEYFKVKHALSFNSGRSCLMAIIDSLQLKGEVLVQAFTCNASVNPIRWSGMKPVFVDCNDNFNIDVNDLKRKITPETKAVMVQHTFGIPADMTEIVKICKENNLILIEDAAHALGAEYSNQKIGTFGKASFFSFSRDKIISSVYGGIVITNDDELAQRIRAFQEKTGYPSLFWIKQQLLHPVLMSSIILPTYRILGRYLLVFFQIIKVLSKAVHRREKKGLIPSYFPKRMPNALALLALNQFKKLERFNAHRRKIAQLYSKDPLIPGAVYLRFPVKHPKAHEIIRKAWDNNLLIGDWYTSPIAPKDTDEEKVGYMKGSCPKAERLSKITFNLPTHINISEKQAKRIKDFLRLYE